MLTVESIEAVPADQLKTIMEMADSLHEGTIGVLDMLSPEDLGQQEELRAAMSLKLQEGMSFLSKRIADLNATKGELRIARGRQVTDKDRIKSRKIAIYVERKEGRA